MKKPITLTFFMVFLMSNFAASFTPGNIVVTRVGPNVYTEGAKAYLDEYTTAGVLVQTIALPTDFYVPLSIDCGITSLSGDGQFLALSGMPEYQATTTASTAYARKVLTVKYDGTVTSYTPTVTTPATTSTISAQTNSGANTFTLSAANAGIAVGQYVYGLGIPIGTTVSAVSGTSLTLSANALANIASGQTLVFMTNDTPLYSNLRAPKGVFTTDGSNFWLGGDDRYIQYYNPNLNGGVPVNIVADYSRFLTSVNGILFKSVRYGTEIAVIGTSANPYPTTSANAVNTSVINSSDDAFQIIAVDVDATVDGQDVMYVAENNGKGTLYGIKKYSKVGTTWTYNGGFGTLANGYSGVTAKVTAQGIVTIYTISRPTVSGNHGGQLTKYVDNAGYNVAPNLTETTVLQSFDQATSPKGGSWRSVNLVPEDKNKTISSTTSISSLNITPSTNITVTSELTIDAPRTLNSVTVAAGGKLTITAGSLNTTNGITLESDATGTATLMDSYTEPTLNVTVKQYLSSARNWYFTPAVSGVSVPSGSTYFGYDETGLNDDLAPAGSSAYWKPYASGAPLTAGKGYIVQPGAATTLSFKNNTNSGDVSPVLTYNADKGKGYNLVGNPYPSYLIWSEVYNYDFANEKTANMPTGTIWYRTINDNGKSAWTANNTTYHVNDVVYNGTRFYKATSISGPTAATGGPTGVGTGIVDNGVTWNYEGTMYVFATVNASGVASPSNVSSVSNQIPPMQAFWVRTGVGGGTLRFKNSMRSHNTSGGNNALKAPKSTANEMPLIRLSVTNGVAADETVIYAGTNASNAFDAYDAPKYFNAPGSNQPELYSQIGTEKLTINAMNELSTTTEITLGFATEKANNFSISATELKNVSPDMQVVLKDKQTNTEFELADGKAYTFSSPVVKDANRFSLLFKSKGSTTDIEKTSKLNAQVFVNAANQITIIAPENCNYAIFNAVGQVISTGKTSHSLHLTPPYHQGVYIVQLKGNGNELTTKVIVK